MQLYTWKNVLHLIPYAFARRKLLDQMKQREEIKWKYRSNGGNQMTYEISFVLIEKQQNSMITDYSQQITVYTRQNYIKKSL